MALDDDQPGAGDPPPTAAAPPAAPPAASRRRAVLVVVAIAVVVVAVVAGVAVARSRSDTTGVDASQGDDVAAGTTMAPEDIGPALPGAWTGARTDGSAVIVTFYGQAPVTDPDDPCQSDYGAAVAETDQSVTVTLHGSHVDTCGEDIAYGRSLRVELADPLGGRQLTNGATGQPMVPFDGARLLEAGWLPEGWQQTADRPSDPAGSAQVVAWQIGWSDPTAVTTCGAEVSPVTLTVGTASDLLSQTWVTSYVTVGPTAVRGHPAEQARYRAGPVEHPSNETMIRWSEGDEGYVLRSAPSCPDGAPADFALLQHIADELR